MFKAMAKHAYQSKIWLKIFINIITINRPTLINNLVQIRILIKIKGARSEDIVQIIS